VPLDPVDSIVVSLAVGKVTYSTRFARSTSDLLQLRAPMPKVGAGPAFKAVGIPYRA
jgi:hypothetical protein